LPTATATATETATVTPTSTAQPLLTLVPPSGPVGTELTLTGKDFEPYQRHLFFWDSMAQVIYSGYADDIGQIAGFSYQVPDDAVLGTHDIIAAREDGTEITRVPFEVTAQ
jgi:hypothetical protein